MDRETHSRRLSTGGYRPKACPRCGHSRLHVHDYRERKLRGQEGDPVIRVVRYLCPACGATWQVLPRFVARHLWRSWEVVEAATLGPPPPPTAPHVPERTVRRWMGRLLALALMATQVLATSGAAAMEQVAQAVGLSGTRMELVHSYQEHFGVPQGLRLCALAALLHRLEPGVRLM